MPPTKPRLLQGLEQACDAAGYHHRIIDPWSNNLLEVTDGRKTFFANTSALGIYPINAHFASELAKDKAWLYLILQEHGYRIPKGDHFFLTPHKRQFRGEGREREDAFTFADQLGYPIFVKPNHGSRGRFAEIVYTQEELENHLNLIETEFPAAILQEVISQPEYRLFLVDGEIQFSYRRLPATIMGNGRQTFAELVDQMNAKIDDERYSVRLTSPFLTNQMQMHGISSQTILEQDRQIQVASASNLSSGGIVADYCEQFPDELKQWAAAIFKLLNLRVCGIDVFVPNGLDNPASFTFIEINSSPSLTGIAELGKTEMVASIWKKVLERYFE